MFRDRLAPILYHHPLKEHEGYLFFIANTNDAVYGSRHGQDQFIYEIIPSKIVGDKEVFKTQYANEIQKLKEIFGNTNVEIEWGVIGDCS